MKVEFIVIFIYRPIFSNDILLEMRENTAIREDKILTTVETMLK